MDACLEGVCTASVGLGKEEMTGNGLIIANTRPREPFTFTAPQRVVRTWRRWATK